MIPPLLPPADPRAAVARALVASDWWRADLRTGPPMEWKHLVVVRGAWRLVLNLSVERGVARVVVLVGEGGAWRSWAQELRDLEIERGRVDAWFGESHLRMAGDQVHVRLRLPGLQAELWADPVTPPLVATRLAFPPDGVFHWVGVPRLEVERGWVDDGARRELAGALAYLDHDWGTFDFDADFAWEWGFGVPESVDDPWSLVLLRVSDRARLTTRVAGLAIWRDGRLWRTFRDDEVQYAPGRFRRKAAHRTPKELGDVAPEAGSMPETCVWEARGGGDVLRVEMTMAAHAQLIVPGARLSRISEAAARLAVSGTVRGRPITAVLNGMLEVIDG